jgi:hypothetical protein
VRAGSGVTRRLGSGLALVVVAILVLGGCSSDDGEDPDTAQAASDVGGDEGAGDGSSSDEDDEAFCAVVDEQLETATGTDLLEAYPAIEAIADAAPDDLADAFEENLVALEPAARAEDADEARQVFIEEVAPNEAYTDSLADIADGISDRCDVDIDDAG